MGNVVLPRVYLVYKFTLTSRFDDLFVQSMKIMLISGFQYLSISVDIDVSIYIYIYTY